MKTLYDSSLITVWFHTGRNVVHHRLNRPILNEELDTIKAAFTAGTEAMRAARGSKWLSDDRNQLVMPPEIQHWCQTVWYPATVAVGWRRWAIVQPDSPTAKLFITRLAGLVAQDGINVQLLSDVPEALTWLERSDQTRAES